MKLKIDSTGQKLSGAYYTPSILADKIIGLFDFSSVSSILEPSCGDGIFIDAVIKSKKAKENCIIDAVEINNAETAKLQNLYSQSKQVHIVNDDFFSYHRQYCGFKKYDFIVGNPPYIRYQYLEENQRKMMSDLLVDKGMKPNKLINTWVGFLVACVEMLSDNGKIAFIIPAEIMQVLYAEDLRCYLSNHLEKITLLTFKKLVFPDIEQEIVVFIGEKGNKEKGIRIIEMNNLESFDQLDLESNGFQKTEHSKEKWTKYFANSEENIFMTKLRNDVRFQKFSDIALINVGITTGNNKFFSVDNSVVQKYHLDSVVCPLIGRSSHAKGIYFTDSDWKQNVTDNRAAYFLRFPDIPLENLPPQHQKYIIEGENTGENNGYKCSIREHWYSVPSVWVPDAFLLRRINTYSKFVVNKCDAVSTDTMHRVKFKDGIDPDIALLSYYNSITFASAESSGRSYGGGALEILPKEAGNILLPVIDSISIDDVRDILSKVNSVVQNNENIEIALDIVDKELLHDKLNIDMELCIKARVLWKKLQSRRLERGA